MPAFEGLLLRQMVMTQKAQAMHVLDVKKGREEVDSRQSRQTETEGKVVAGKGGGGLNRSDITPKHQSEGATQTPAR